MSKIDFKGNQQIEYHSSAIRNSIISDAPDMGLYLLEIKSNILNSLNRLQIRVDMWPCPTVPLLPPWRDLNPSMDK